MTIEARRLARGVAPSWLARCWGVIDRDTPRARWFVEAVIPGWNPALLGPERGGAAMPERSEWEAQIDRTLAALLVALKAVEARLEAAATAHAALLARLDALAARVEASDASYVRHQGQHQDTWDHLGRRLDGARRRADDLERRLARVEGDAGAVPGEVARLVDRVAAAERRVARLDAHGGALARQALDIIIRVDALEEHLTERLRGLEARQRDLEGP
jgi:chromosome segregation ATPase